MNKSQQTKQPPKAYSRVLLGNGDEMVVYRDEMQKELFRLSVSRCNAEWMYWVDSGVSGFGAQVVIGDTLKLSVNPDRPADHILLCFEMMTKQTVSIRVGQSQGAGLSMMIERAGTSTPRLN